MPVIDRKLLQCDYLDFAQFYHALHPLPRFHEAARLAEFKQFYQEHLKRVIRMSAFMIREAIHTVRIAD